MENVIFLDIYRKNKKQERDKRLFDIDACIVCLEKTHSYLNSNPMKESNEVNRQIKKTIVNLKKAKEEM